MAGPGRRGAGRRRSPNAPRGVEKGGLRAFLALELPDAHRELIGREQRRLRQELPPARWVRPEGIHLTIKFLGESSRDRLERLSAGLKAKLASCTPVEVRLAGSGFFPGPARPRVAWIGGSAAGATALAHLVEQVAESLGFERERRPWSLHLTLARLRDPWPQRAVERFLSWGEGLEAPSFECHELVLFSSRLQPGGAVYAVLERISLGGRDGGRG